jgi:hypothetical protein
MGQAPSPDSPGLFGKERLAERAEESPRLLAVSVCFLGSIND